MKDNGIASLLAIAASVSLSVCAFASPTPLSGHTYRMQDITKDVPSYVVSSVAEDGWPDDAPTPIFWFDCTQTNGWEFSTDANGSNCVAKIPSLVGDGRFLTTNQTLEGSSFTRWSLKAPFFLASDADLGGKPAIDFGRFNSSRGMVFNPVFVKGGDTAKTNTLENIGTIVAVYGSQQGGGSFLAGGYNPLPPSSTRNGKLWSRSHTKTISNENADSVRVDYPAPIVSASRDGIAYGKVRHFGLACAPLNSGFSGGWEVFSFCTTGAIHSATGIGFGEATATYYHSGGMRIAEMAFFDSVLDNATLEKVERHLARKWFMREESGYNGRTTLEWYRLNAMQGGASANAEFDVPAGETLRIGKLQGGRLQGSAGPSTVTKSGAGTLVPGDFSKFGGNVVSKGGKIAFEKKRIPAVGDLAERLYIRFDASEPGACDLAPDNGTNFVACLVNLADGTYLGKAIYARQKSQSLRPWLRTTELGGRPVLDFGGAADVNHTDHGAIMRFTTDTDSSSYSGITLPSVFTVVAVVQAHNGGGHLLNNMFQRSTRWPWGMRAWYSSSTSADYYATHRVFGLLERENTYGTGGYGTMLNATNGTAWVNGRKYDSHTLGYETPGWQTVALRVPGHGVAWLGGETETTVRGRFRLGEILIWLHPLSDEEIVDAQAYLAKKWLGRTLPGYESGEKAGAPEIQSLVVAGETEINVPDGATARIGTLATNARTVKTGGGTLYVAEEESTMSGLVVEGGDVRVVEPLVTNQCQLAADPSLHLDAAATNHMTFWQKDGTNFVYRWFDENSRNTAFSNDTAAKRHPFLNTYDTLNGLPSIDMGPAHYDWSRDYAYMCLDRLIDSARSVFVVCGSQNGGNTLFGNASPSDGYDARTAGGSVQYYLDWSVTVSGGRRSELLSSSAHANLRNGEIYVDGVLTNRLANPTGWALEEYHALGGVHISSLNMRQDGTYNCGGNRYCEVLVYERRLSEREKVATRNYLTRKWFPGRPLQELPEETAESRAPVAAYASATSSTNEFSFSEDASVYSLEGDGTFVKDGDGTLSLFDISDFSGVLSVKSGEVSVTGSPMTNAPALVASGMTLHLDAMEGLTVVRASDNGSNVVSRWESRLGDGWDAIPGCHPDSASKTNMPYYIAHDVNGRYPGVNIFSESGWNDRKCWMRFRKDGEPATLRNIRTAFWVLGSQEGGGVLFGGGRNTDDVQTGLWYRNTENGTGQSYGYDCREGLIGYLCSAEMKAADLYVNGQKVPAYWTPGVLSGEYDIVTFRLQEGVSDEKAPNADGLAFWTENINNRGIDGHQRLGEVIVYDRVLSEEERLSVESYLRAKWGFSQKAATNSATVSVASGATLSTVGNQYIDTLDGSGAVEGDVTVRNFVRDMAGGAMAVNGTVTIAENPTVEILNAPGSVRGGDAIAVVSAGAFAGKANLSAATVNGVPENLSPRLVVRNGTLYVYFRNGFQLIVK